MNARPDPKELSAAKPAAPVPQPEYEPYYTREPDPARQEVLDALEQHYAYYTRD